MNRSQSASVIVQRAGRFIWSQTRPPPDRSGSPLRHRGGSATGVNPAARWAQTRRLVGAQSRQLVGEGHVRRRRAVTGHAGCRRTSSSSRRLRQTGRRRSVDYCPVARRGAQTPLCAKSAFRSRSIYERALWASSFFGLCRALFFKPQKTQKSPPKPAINVKPAGGSLGDAVQRLEGRVALAEALQGVPRAARRGTL